MNKLTYHVHRLKTPYSPGWYYTLILECVGGKPNGPFATPQEAERAANRAVVKGETIL